MIARDIFRLRAAICGIVFAICMHALADEPQSALDVRIALLREQMVSCEPLLIACEWTNRGLTTIEFEDDPTESIKILTSCAGGTFREQEWNGAPGSDSAEPFVLAPGHCDRMLLILFNDQRTNTNSHCSLNQPGEYRVKVRMQGTESNVVPIRVLPESRETCREVNLLSKIDNNVALMPVGTALVSDVGAWEALLERESFPPFLADYVHCILGRHYFVKGLPERVRTTGRTQRDEFKKSLQHFRAIRSEQRLLRADALRGIEILITSEPDLVLREEWHEIVAEFEKKGDDLRWILRPDFPFRRVFRELREYSFYGIPDDRLEKHVSWDRCTLQAWCAEMQRQSGVTLSSDGVIKARIIDPAPKQVTLRGAMVAVSYPDCIWEQREAGYELRLDERTIADESCAVTESAVGK